ncbi:MAG: ETC complex I subunit [Alphaproteobacteria bacterium]
MDVRIYRPAKNAMQSGKAKTKEWVLEFEPTAPRTHDPLMGWTSSRDTRQQLRLRFSTKEEAVAYARAEGLMYTVQEPKPHRIQPKAYADNFAYGRRQPWTH